MRSWSGSTFRDRGAIYLDGVRIQDFNADGMSGYVATEQLKPGSEHVLALEIQGTHALCGATGSAWISHLPDPAARQDLSGAWRVTHDGLHETAPVHLPGAFQGMFASRTFRADAGQAGQQYRVLHRRRGAGLRRPDQRSDDRPPSPYARPRLCA